MATARAELVARAQGVVAGLVVVVPVLEQVAARLALAVPDVELRAQDGDPVRPGQVLAVVTGPVQVILVAERTLLNLASRASGVATHTRRWADVLAGSGASVLDTRKTTPGLRALEKYAVRCGGGTNKRMGLYDVAMIKDNHLVAEGGIGALKAAIQQLQSEQPAVEVELEADNLDQVRAFLAIEDIDYILLDNMSPAELCEAVAARGDHTCPRLEASGGVTLETLREIAETGVDFISVGALTHSAPALDIGLDFSPL